MTWEAASVIIAATVPLTAAIIKLVPSRGRNGNGCGLPQCLMKNSADFIKLKADVHHLRKSLDELKQRVDDMIGKIIEWMRRQ